MSTLTIEKGNAIAALKVADEPTKKVLKALLGENNLYEKITERVKTLKDACEVLGKDYVTIYGNETDPVERAEIAIKTFAEALREGKPASECWYYPYFLRSSSGGFSYYDFGIADDFSGVGARLRVDTGEKAKHLGQCMLDFYKTYINGK